PGKAIFTLTGIKYFPGLAALDCSGNYLSSLDLSGNSSLFILKCNDNLIDTLQISACTNLVSLNCENNKLTKLGFYRQSESVLRQLREKQPDQFKRYALR
ncbi:MAG: hypothetical protein IKR59_09925, partial [Lachnospiraceae bacterium]|nr:hypothetical protein [Lachnospiraceae bacterium]